MAARNNLGVMGTTEDNENTEKVDGET